MSRAPDSSPAGTLHSVQDCFFVAWCLVDLERQMDDVSYDVLIHLGKKHFLVSIDVE